MDSIGVGNPDLGLNLSMPSLQVIMLVLSGRPREGRQELGIPLLDTAFRPPLQDKRTEVTLS